MHQFLTVDLEGNFIHNLWLHIWQYCACCVDMQITRPVLSEFWLWCTAVCIIMLAVTYSTVAAGA